MTPDPSAHQRVAELAAFLDPVAFERAHDRTLAKRRDAAWREACNRIAQVAARA
jgi:hypothetical protein